MLLQLPQKKRCVFVPFVTHTTLSHTLFHTHNFHTHHLSHTTLSQPLFHTQLCHAPTFFVTRHISHTLYHTQLFTYNLFYFSILHHLLCLSFLPRPATTFVAHYWKKLTCGVIRSFYCFCTYRNFQHPKSKRCSEQVRCI